ncbi:MAG: GNAT family N-acetyltransferase [Bacilli bacterium]|nr:GNAT family N-acetyltransferase [Bacilli bacterium]
MKIIDYNKTLDKKKIADSAYRICGNAEFPVEYQDVYEHLFENDNLTLKLLLNEENHLAGFGVFENYRLFLESQIITMLYLSGMAIDPRYQGKNVSREIIKNAYRQFQSDLISLRTQNIAMAKSLLDTFNDNLFVMPGNTNDEILSCLRQASPFEDIDEYGVIRNCYPNQLYSDLNAIQENFGIKLQSTDALGVVIEPSRNKQKVLSLFNQIKK